MIQADRTPTHHTDNIIHYLVYLIRVYRVLYDSMAASNRDECPKRVPSINLSLCCRLQVLVGHVRSDQVLLQGMVMKYNSLILTVLSL